MMKLQYAHNSYIVILQQTAINNTMNLSKLKQLLPETL